MVRTTRPCWYDGQKRPIEPGGLIKSGGAGSVYHLAGGRVVKIYHDTIDKAYYQRKIAAMLTLTPHLPPVPGKHDLIQLAWPVSSLLDKKQRFAGFIMPELDVKASIELEYILQERQARAHGLPVGLGAKVSLAANLCTLVTALHQQRHRIIDLKPINLRFYKESLHVAMLDCDGFSIQGHKERFPANQFTSDYLAPEFQASGRIPEDEEEYQDRFALAVILFQLLNFGIHPYSGRLVKDDLPTDLPGRIRHRLYAYGLKPHRFIEPSPVSGHQSMPQAIRELFDLAFAAAAHERPSAQVWVQCLRPYALRSNDLLKVCAKDPEHQHFAGHPCAACARTALLARTAQAQKTTQRQQKKRKRVATAQPVVRAAVVRPPPVPVPAGPPSHWRMGFYGLLSVAAPVIFALLTAMLSQQLSQDLGNFNAMIAGFIASDYFEQMTSGMIGLISVLIVFIMIVMLVVLPFNVIRRSGP